MLASTRLGSRYQSNDGVPCLPASRTDCLTRKTGCPDIEAAMLALSKFASTVVEDEEPRTRWIAEVEINLMTKVFAVPKRRR